jgi:hypothetical protein
MQYYRTDLRPVRLTEHWHIQRTWTKCATVRGK